MLVDIAAFLVKFESGVVGPLRMQPAAQLRAMAFSQVGDGLPCVSNQLAQLRPSRAVSIVATTTAHRMSEKYTRSIANLDDGGHASRAECTRTDGSDFFR